MRALALVLATALPAAADEVTVRAGGPLDDDAFFRAVTCGAPPGGDCATPVVGWPPDRAGSLTVGVVAVADGYPPAKRRRIERALDAAIAEINRLGAAVRLAAGAEGTVPDIKITLAAAREGEPMRDAALPGFDGIPMPAGFVYWAADGEGRFTAVHIMIARDIPDADIRSVVLEEIMQGLGFPVDIEGDWYGGRSIFAQDSNVITTLEGQDAMAVRRKYPPDR